MSVRVVLVSGMLISALAAASWQLKTRAVLPNGSLLPAPTPAEPPSAVWASGLGDNPVPELWDLCIPVEGVTAAQLVDSFSDSRGARVHEAIDIASPAGTPVRAVDTGRIVKLFLSKPGGITIYQFDPTQTYAYYYAHLERYADGLVEGQTVARGDLIGYVGSSGNANPSALHLHFAIIKLGPERRWWQGQSINPYGRLKWPSAKKDAPPTPPEANSVDVTEGSNSDPRGCAH